MSLEQHFKELREALICYVIVAFVFFAFSYKNSDFVLTALIESAGDYRSTLYFSGLTEGFGTHLRISFAMALLLSLPFGLYKIFSFVKPALQGKEKTLFPRFLICSFLLFFLGVTFAYLFVIPTAWNFLTSFESYLLCYLPNATDYINFVLGCMIAFGLCFQLPILLILLAKFDIVTKEQLINFRRYNIVLAFVIGAILTPPDIASQIFLSSFIILLYESTLLFIKKKENA